MSEDWWIERQQNRRLAGLEEDLDYVSASLSQARTAQNRLKAELSKVSGSLEQRLDRLSSAFDAFVEISDLRVTLGLFDEHGRVRHQARQLVAGAAIGDVSDADGYWLAPALVALRGVGDSAVDEEALALATARDPLRTRTFHVLLAATLRGKLPSAQEVFPELDGAVPMHHRAVWLLAADGFLGAEGWELAKQHCARLVSAAPADELSAALRSAAFTKAAVHIPKELDGGGTLATALQACEKLKVLRAWVAETVDGYTGEPATAPDPLVRRTLDLLVDEGSPIELPLLVRERELRAVIEGRDTTSSMWDATVGQAVDLMKEDLTSDRPDRRAVVVRACAPLLVATGEKLAAEARVEPPASLSVRTRYGQVTITPTGPDQASLDKAVGMVDRASQVESKRRPAAVGAAVAAVLFVVLAVTAGWGWSLLAVVAAGVGLYQWLTDGKERRAAAESAVRLKQSLRDDVAKRVELYATTHRELRDRQPGVTEDLAAVEASLATVAG